MTPARQRLSGRLPRQSGEDVGDYITAIPNWRPGDPLYDQGLTRFKVVEVVDLTDVVDPSEEPEHFIGALVVTPVELAEPA